MKSYIIHLDRAVARKQQVAYLQKNLPGEVQVLHAVDGKLLTDADKCIYQRKLHRPFYPFRMRDSEIACFLSHRKAWQTIVDSGDDFALIAEDDIHLHDPEFSDSLSLAMRNMTVDKFVRFPLFGRETPIQTVEATEHTTLFLPKSIGLGMVLQLVGRNYAKAMLDLTEKFDRPVDVFLQLHWITGLVPMVLFPSFVSEISENVGGSTIGAKKSVFGKIWHEVARPYYRTSLKFVARKHKTTK